MIQHQAPKQAYTASTANNVLTKGRILVPGTNHEDQQSREGSINKKHQHSSFETQDVVPGLVEKSSNAKIEVLQNSNGPPLVYERDPHLRLRRTLTVRPPTFPTGTKKYSEAQFAISSSSSSSPSTGSKGSFSTTTTGKRITLAFSAPVEIINGTTAAAAAAAAGSSTTNVVHDFHMDAYVFGASEDTATIRMVALHGISPTTSRERWHNLGKTISEDPQLNQKCDSLN